jgi:2-dehydro-3-deoxyphosphogluconate aldolase/(4S)-4-hydroxy-2-oxoglutarate aldolase
MSGHGGQDRRASVLARLAAERLVPVVEIADAADSPRLAEALLAGGVSIVEITFRTPGAADAIAAVRRGFPGMLVGAGTVIDPRQVDLAADLGADFLVSPGFGPRVIDRATARDLPILPGVTTATEIQLALEAGLTNVKLFPAEALGGVRYLRALTAPFAGVGVMPTGGIDAATAPGYLALPNVIAVGGSWFARREWIAARDFAAVEAGAREAVALVAAARPG